ncbi:hypothetical protein H0H92_012544, partial [Tricholoma furcatifolium]
MSFAHVMPASPAKRRFEILTGNQPSLKRQRTSFDSPKTLSQLRGPGAIPTGISYVFNSQSDDSGMLRLSNADIDLVCKVDATSTVTTSESTYVLPSLAPSHAAMDKETHLTRKDLQEGMKVGKGTETAYPRHVKNYVNFMIRDQAARKAENPDWIVVPPFPIT